MNRNLSIKILKYVVNLFFAAMEIGPQPHGVVRSNIYTAMKCGVQHVLDWVNFFNSGAIECSFLMKTLCIALNTLLCSCFHLSFPVTRDCFWRRLCGCVHHGQTHRLPERQRDSQHHSSHSSSAPGLWFSYVKTHQNWINFTHSWWVPAT